MPAFAWIEYLKESIDALVRKAIMQKDRTIRMFLRTHAALGVLSTIHAAPIEDSVQISFQFSIWQLSIALSGLVLLLIVLLLLPHKKASKKSLPVPGEDDDVIVPPSRESLAEPKPVQETEKLWEKTMRPLPVQKYKAYLYEKNGAHANRRYRIQWHSINLGTNPECSVVVHDELVSDFHCAIKFHNEKFFLYDLISKNGTFLNGRKLLRPKPLHEFDEIQLGRTKFIFRRVQS